MAQEKFVQGEFNWHEKLNRNSDVVDSELNKVSDRTTVLEGNLYNPNLLINSNFKVSELVNQRGQTSYGETSGYIFDMWKKYLNGSFDLTGEYVKMINSTGNDHRCTQLIENFKDFNGRTVTISARIRSSTNSSIRFTINTGVDNTVLYENISSNFEIYSYTMTISNPTQLAIHLGLITVGEIEIDYIKFECGSVATKFVDDARATKLLKCQRYLQSFKYFRLYRASSVAVNNLKFNIDLVTQMRTKPTLLFGEETIDWRVTDLAFTVPQSGFVLTMANSYENGAIVLYATKTAHGLSDGIFEPYTSNNYLSAEL